MISALLFAATLAHADETVTYDRLFGTEAPTEVTGAPAEPPSPWRLLGPAALGVVGLFAAWKLRGGKPLLSTNRPIEILGRQSLGDRNTLLVIEVVEADGERRRLLVGTGASAPTLVADLGCKVTPNVAEEFLAERQDRSFPAVAARRGLAC
jgi:hypothetical protein